MVYRSGQFRSSAQSRVKWPRNSVHRPKLLGLLRSTQPVVRSLSCSAAPIGELPSSDLYALVHFADAPLVISSGDDISSFLAISSSLLEPFLEALIIPLGNR